jgi:uncharacterized protein
VPYRGGMGIAVMLTLATFGWSLFANLVLGDRGYVVRNLVATGLLLWLASTSLSVAELGLDPGAFGEGVRWGRLVVLAAAVAVALAAGFGDRFRPIAALLADRRAALSFHELVMAVLVRIPLGTALFEEVLFRGVLLGVFLSVGSVSFAVAWSSVAFGLWHVAPTIVALRANGVAPRSRAGRRAVGGAVLVTGLAGVGFALLTLASGSLLAPFLAHWAVNAFGLLAAAVSQTSPSSDVGR